MRRSRRLSFIIVLLLLSAACASGAAAVKPAAPVSAEAADMYEKAEAYYRNNFLAKAMETFLAVIERWPSSQPGAASMSRVGAIYQKANLPEKALNYYEMLVARHPDNPLAVEAHRQIGVCRRQLGQHEEAIAALSYYISVAGVKNPDEARLLLGDSYEHVKKFDDALLTYAAAAVHSERDTQVETLKKARRIVDEELTPAHWLTVIPRLPEGPIADFTRFRVAEWLVEHGRRPEAATLLRAINYTKKPYTFYEKAEKLLDVAEAQAPRAAAEPTRAAPSLAPAPVAAAPLAPATPTETPRRSVGVILTLSGPEASFGQQVLQGIMQGVELFGPGGAGRFQAVVRDDAGDPDIAAKFVDELADDPTVFAIIGPLLGKCAEKAVAEAELRGVPLIALTARENILGPGQWTFRNFLTPSAEVKALIQYATGHQGAFRFAILYPDSAQGRTYRDLFTQFLDPQHYRLVAAVAYSPNETDYKRAIAQLQAHGQFDALFLPDGSRQIALLAPQLVYYGVRDVLLLGVNSWNDDDLAKRAGRYLTKAVFVDAFFPRSKANAEIEPFVQRYEEAFHHPPNILAAAGYDTARIMAKIVGRPGELDRAAVIRELLRVRDFPGVTGDITIGENRDAERRLFLLRVGASQIEEIY
jgi:ABC-type branched-subunit amino acid transport system substrate-binding protein/outer membrane protein assembly factor BamD (BamD/ComL family)